MLAVVVLAVAVTGALRYNEQRAAAADKARFLQADRDVARIADDIIAAVGQPQKITTERSCSRPSVKFEEAPLFCSTDRSIYFGVSSINEANEIHEKSSRVLGESKLVNFGVNELGREQYDRSSDYKIAKLDFKSAEMNMQCSLSSVYYFSDLPPFDYPQIGESEFSVSVTASCSDVAEAEHFPVR